MTSGKTRERIHCLLLLLTALIWGISFVSQSEGGDALGPYAFNSARSIIGSIVLLPVIRFIDYKGNKKKPVTKADKKLLWKAGILCGLALFAATNLQQVGMYYGTSAGKAGFLTAIYILLVPILGLFLKKKCGWNVWVGVAMGLLGLYLLCIKGGFAMESSDLLVLGCALFFSVQILLVDKYSPIVDGVRLSSIQFMVVGVLGFIVSFCVEMNASIQGLVDWLALVPNKGALIALLYSGVMSSGVAYTLQIVAQDGVNPTVASLLMSFESVFAALAGWIILGEALSTRELLGCVILFGAIVLAQLPGKIRK